MDASKSADRITRSNSTSSDAGNGNKITKPLNAANSSNKSSDASKNGNEKIFELLKVMQSTIDSNAKDNKAKFASLDSKISSMNDTWKNELAGILNKHMSDVEGKLTSVSKRIELYENKIELLERKSRANDILLRGVPYMDKENLVSFFGLLAKEIKYPYDNMYSVSSIFRLYKPKRSDLVGSFVSAANDGAPSGKPSPPPPVLVTFTTPRLKSAFCRLFNICKNLDYNKFGLDSSHRIYVTDNLTKSNSEILRKALQMKSSNRVDKVQVRNGIVLVNHKNEPSPVKVLNILDLDL